MFGNANTKQCPVVAVCLAMSFQVAAGAREHSVDAPFVHVHKDSRGKVSVDAPFTHVRNPKGSGNAKVDAPFTHVKPHSKGSAQSSAAAGIR